MYGPSKLRARLWWATPRLITWRALLAIAVALALSIGFAALLAFQKRPVNLGFGPEWKCYQTIKRGPVCFRNQRPEPIPLYIQTETLERHQPRPSDSLLTSPVKRQVL